MEGEKKGTFDGRMGDFRHYAVEGTTNVGAIAQCAKERGTCLYMRHGNGWKKRVTEVAVASCKLRGLGSKRT